MQDSFFGGLQNLRDPGWFLTVKHWCSKFLTSLKSNLKGMKKVPPRLFVKLLGFFLSILLYLEN